VPTKPNITIDIQGAFQSDFFCVETNQFQELLADGHGPSITRTKRLAAAVHGRKPTPASRIYLVAIPTTVPGAKRDS
jgi:hypothetical protein